jgi:recombinational DNA repair protein (RecF pathway)
MFRLILLTVREIERTGDWALPLSYFAFWTVRLGGWLPRFDRCSLCATPFGEGTAYHAPWEPGLLCERCRRPGMKPLHAEARKIAERFAGESLERIESGSTSSNALSELREASLNWIEHNSDRKLKTRELLETT